MKPEQPSLELVPLDRAQASAPDGEKAAAPLEEAPTSIEIVALDAGKRSRPPPPDKTDRFVREATRQYEEGHIDQPLWDRALAQSAGDKALAAATYLQARALALRLLDRDRRSGRLPPPPAAIKQEPLETATEDMPVGIVANDAWRRSGISRHRNWIVVAAVLVPVGIGMWLLSTYWKGSPARNTEVAQVAPVVERPAKVAPAVEVPAKPKVVAKAEARPAATPEFLNKIQELTDAGNWNVLVLYAVEWTRRDPANPAAWSLLRTGYVNLKQYRDALEAATKAVQLAPGDARMWRSLGQVNMELDDSDAALRAFAKAAAQDAHDVDSLKEVGILNARLGRPVEAKLAFDQALALSPGDATAQCLRAAVVQLPATQKDAYVAAKEAKSTETRCRAVADPGVRR
ncbi:MAG: hypothetical protein ABI624_21440 [Casimicrobiaceae bacterium]